MNFSTKEGQPLGIKEAENQINGIWSLIGGFGNIGGEKDLIDDILRRLKSEEISPKDAVDEANSILVNKNGFLTQYK